MPAGLGSRVLAPRGLVGHLGKGSSDAGLAHRDAGRKGSFSPTWRPQDSASVVSVSGRGSPAREGSLWKKSRAVDFCPLSAGPDPDGQLRGSPRPAAATQRPSLRYPACLSGRWDSAWQRAPWLAAWGWPCGRCLTLYKTFGFHGLVICFQSKE